VATLWDMRLPEPPELSAAIVSADPLARGGLQAVLSSIERLDVSLSLHPEDLPSHRSALRGMDALLWDLGLSGEGELAAPLPAPTLVLARDAAEAREALDGGARGAIRRDAKPAQISAALTATAEGLWVLDPGFGAAMMPTAPVRSLVEPLSAREQEVLALLVEGLSNKEIGRRLFISAHTAKFHVNAILTKLDASGRTEAAVAAVRMGLVRL